MVLHENTQLHLQQSRSILANYTQNFRKKIDGVPYLDLKSLIPRSDQRPSHLISQSREASDACMYSIEEDAVESPGCFENAKCEKQIER